MKETYNKEMNIEYLQSLTEREFYEYKTFEASGEHYIVDEFDQHNTEKCELQITLELHKIKEMREDLRYADSDFYKAKKQYAICKKAHNTLNTSQSKLNLKLAGKTFAYCKTRLETLNRLNK